jgi:putative transposase
LTKAPWGRRTATKDWQSQAHVKWDCKYHVVILPKYRRRVSYGRLRRGIGQILRDLCRQKDIELVEVKAMPDHIHMLLSVPPRYSIAMTIGYLKGKSATRIHRELLQTKGTLFGRSFWARGYCVSTVGLEIAEWVGVSQPFVNDQRSKLSDNRYQIDRTVTRVPRWSREGQGAALMGESRSAMSARRHSHPSPTHPSRL